ncbi:tyrosine-type recombinase/integrase [Pseudomonas sp. Eth.TT006]
MTLADPVTGKYEWSDAFLGNQSGDRQEFLAQRYGLGPRNKLGLKHPLHAGWKYITYESDRNEATLQWLLPEIGMYFAALHKKYMKNVRNHISDDHPYYFVNTREGPDFGQPMTMSNMDKIFTRAVRKIGLSTSDAGVNPHGARHFFGYFCASYLRLTQEVTQILMRHANISSTQVYYRLDIEIAKTELEKGQKILADSIPDFCQEASHLLGNDRYDH